jgi:hypothetical protein
MENKELSIMDALISLADSGVVTIHAGDYGYGYQKISAAVCAFLNQMLIGYTYRSERIKNSNASFDFLKNSYHFEVPIIKVGNQRSLPLETIKELQVKKHLVVSASWGSDYRWMALALQNLLIYFRVAHEFATEPMVVSKINQEYPPFIKETYRITLLEEDSMKRQVS